MDKVFCFLPCRKGSERIINKNIKPFAGIQHGLIEIKLNQLINSKNIENIYLSTNDDDIISFAESMGNKKIIIHKRNEELASNSASTDRLVEHAYNIIGKGHIFWTHVTSPFVNSKIYDEIIKKYFSVLEQGYDSLMTANLIHGFLWDNEKPINYNRSIEKWPRTQTINPIYEINSAAFIASSEIYNNKHDRIGETPFLYSTDKIIGMDIDWPQDFLIAETIFKAKLGNI